MHYSCYSHSPPRILYEWLLITGLRKNCSILFSIFILTSPRIPPEDLYRFILRLRPIRIILDLWKKSKDISIYKTDSTPILLLCSRLIFLLCKLRLTWTTTRKPSTSCLLFNNTNNNLQATKNNTCTILIEANWTWVAKKCFQESNNASSFSSSTKASPAGTATKSYSNPQHSNSSTWPPTKPEATLSSKNSRIC